MSVRAALPNSRTVAYAQKMAPERGSGDKRSLSTTTWLLEARASQRRSERARSASAGVPGTDVEIGGVSPVLEPDIDARSPAALEIRARGSDWGDERQQRSFKRSRGRRARCARC
jgi:hypothetical protein